MISDYYSKLAREIRNKLISKECTNYDSSQQRND